MTQSSLSGLDWISIAFPAFAAFPILPVRGVGSCSGIALQTWQLLVLRCPRRAPKPPPDENRLVLLDATF